MGSLLGEFADALARCAFCHDQCMAATAEAVATGRQGLVVSRVASLIRMLDRDELDWNRETAEVLFYGLNDGLQHQFCIFAPDGQRIEPFLRAARGEAVRRGLAPAAVAAAAEQARLTGNVFGLAGPLPDPVPPPSPDAPLLIHDAATRVHTPGAPAAARALLAAAGAAPGEVAVASGGWVEHDLGYPDLALAAARQVHGALAAAGGRGPVVTTDPALACALRTLYPQLGLAPDRPVLHLAEYLAGCPRPLPLREMSAVATYHDPGLLARGLGVIEAPRALLRQAAGLTLLEPVSRGLQAGSDGPLAGYPDPEAAAAIAAGRAAELLATGARWIITASPYSAANLSAAQPGVPVMDLFVFLHGALQG